MKYITEILLALVIGLLTFIGERELSKIRSEMSDLRCKVTTTGAEARYQDLELQFFDLTLDDLSMDSPAINDIQTYVKRFEGDLEGCREGKKLLEQYQSLHKGLQQYMVKDYEGAISSFNKLDLNRSLTHRLLGGAKYHRADSLSGKEADQLRVQAEQHLMTAVSSAQRELGALSKQAVLSHLRCNPHLVKKTYEGNKAALACLAEIVEFGHADKNTYYNLAAISSRMGKFDDTIKYFRKYLDQGGRIRDKRGSVQNDPDFRDYIIKSGSHAVQFRVLEEQLQQ